MLSDAQETLHRTVVGVSEAEALSVDYETGSRKAIKFIVRHWRDTRSGGYRLREERDICELCAKQAQRRKRACILAQIPGDVTEMAMAQASATLHTKADRIPRAQSGCWTPSPGSLVSPRSRSKSASSAASSRSRRRRWWA
jgi:hypothetical protein